MMANRNVPATPSQEELREKVNIKNEKNSEERETDTLNKNADADSLPTVSSAVAVNRRSASSSRSQTRIPGPIALGPSCSNVHMNSRKYTSILASTRSPGMSANDSGIQMDSSMADPEPTAMSPTPSPSQVPPSQSEKALKLDEYQTLRELQRVVAEMEAEVALSEKEDRELGQLDAPNADQTSLASDVESGREPDGEDKSGPSGEMPAASEAQQYTLSNEAEQGSAQKPASDNDQDNDASFPQEEDQLAAPKAHQESQANEPGPVSAQKTATDGAQINEEKSEQKDPLAGTTTNEVFQDHQQMLKKQTQIEEPEPAMDLQEAIPQGSEEKSPQIVLEEPSTGSVEAALQQAFANVNQVQNTVSPEEPADALNGAAGGQTVALNQELHGEAEPEPEIGDLDLATTSEAALVTQTSLTNSHVDSSVGNDRRLIHLEELLRNANNVEILRRLLQIGAEANMVDSDPEFGSQETSAEDKDAETDSVPETSTATCTATDTEGSTDEDTELNDDDDEDGADVVSKGFNKTTVSLVWRLLSGKMVHLAGPILFCGIAAGLICMWRKA